MSANMATSDNVISTLNGLIETLKDGQEGFRTAAEGVTNPEYKTLFSSYSQQRAQFASELQKEVRNAGGDPEKAGSVLATLHRGWINIKSTVTGMDEGGILSECERGEDSAVHNYQDAMKQTLPEETQQVIQRQFTQIKEAHDRIRSLRDANN